MVPVLHEVEHVVLLSLELEDHIIRTCDVDYLVDQILYGLLNRHLHQLDRAVGLGVLADDLGGGLDALALVEGQRTF